MTEKTDKLPYDSSEKTSDPDALRPQDGPLKQQGDKLASGIETQHAESAPAPEQPKRR